MSPLVDSHTHMFSHLGGASGYATAEDHLRMLQMYMCYHAEPARRLSDHSPVDGETLHDGTVAEEGAGPHSLLDVNFRAGQCGRLEWTHNGEDVYLQWLPPVYVDMHLPPQLLLQQMARLGVDMAVLQNGRHYGRNNEFYAQAIRKYPGKFIGLADVDEPNAHTPGEIARLEHAVRELGLKGVYYANKALFFGSFEHMLDDRIFDPYWEAVAALDVPVFWEIFGVPDQRRDDHFFGEIARLNRWADRWPQIRSVWTHGFWPAVLEGMPDTLAELLARENFTFEMLFPVRWGRTHQYPYKDLRPAMQTFYNRAGGHRLVWGSDLPNVERNCTYRQSLEYLETVGDMIPSSDMDRILGLNILDVLRVTL